MALVFLLTIGSVPLFAAWMAQQGARLARGRGISGRRSPRCCSTSWRTCCFSQAMRIAPLSVTIPLLSLTPVFATLLAIPLLGERPTPSHAFGILLVVAGAIGLHWRRSGADGSGHGTAPHSRGR